jgi:predicted AAA+ superfamily ATPase
VHSGAGRIVNLRMRPLALSERGIQAPTVSLASLLRGGQPPLSGDTAVGLADYAEEIVRSGFPALRRLEGRQARAQLDGYIDQLVEHDFEALGGVRTRNPVLLRDWLTAYAAATSTTASRETIRRAAGARAEVPARPTIDTYDDALRRLWLVDPIPPWLPTRNRLSRLSMPWKHHLVDPALAARLLGVDSDGLLGGAESDRSPRGAGVLLAALFESLVSLSVRTLAQAAEARVSHLRTRGGEHEIDLILERADGRILAIEVKLGGNPDAGAVQHLDWLARQPGPPPLDRILITTGRSAYRRPDGIGVVPAVLLGP